jgi:hypothetical protein
LASALLVFIPEIRMHYHRTRSHSQMRTKLNLALAVALAATLGASHADAQGRGRGNDDRDRHEHRDDRRDRDDDDRPRFDRRDDDRGSRASQRRVPPGWCQGRGNPHNTAANCRYNDRQRRWEIYDGRTRRYETYETWSRNRSVSGSRGVTGSRAAYDRAHRDFHNAHDRRCRERASQRRLDVRYQAQVRSECRSAHDQFHRRWNIAHR